MKDQVLHETSNASELLSEYAACKRALAQIKLDIEVQEQEIRDQYHNQIVELESAQNNAKAALEAYAKKHRSNFKVMKFVSGDIGFRKGQAKVKFLEGFSDKEAIKTLLETKSGLSKYFGFIVSFARYIVSKSYKHSKFVRFKRELDLVEVIKSRDNEADKLLFEKIKIEVVQEENFYIKLNEESNLFI